MRNKQSYLSKQHRPSAKRAKPHQNGNGAEHRTKRRRSWTEEQKQRIVDTANVRIANGATVEESADAEGIVASVLQRWRKQFGDGSGPRPPKPERVGRSGLTPTQKKAAVARLLRGEASPRQLAGEFRISDSAIYVWKKLYGAEVAAMLKNGGTSVAVVPAASAPQRVTVIPAMHAKRANGGGASVGEADLAVRETYMLLQNAARDLDETRPADLDQYQLKTLMARGRLRTVFGK